MALAAEEADPEDGAEEDRPSPITNGRAAGDNTGEEEASEEEEEEEDEEPRLKYATLTKHLKPVYQNGDATSAFLVAGDKMVKNIL